MATAKHFKADYQFFGIVLSAIAGTHYLLQNH